ncbi:MAG: hypothetical protein QOE19_12 [Actinomycetota bacterium]|jgi:hypothetical protein|nr:hypothetical protein [Actinomycetota bacterium]MDQ1666520.1 hypothetical protein [Actinomycetota bacterium]MDQ1670921.1 hypothetical protein [Actinomycetota bacterium]
MYLLSRDTVPLAVSEYRDNLRHFSPDAQADRWTRLAEDHEISESGFEIFPLPQL